MQDSSQNERSKEMSLLEAVAVLALSWKLLVIVPFCVAIIAALASFVLPVKYETTTLVQVDIHGRPDVMLDSFIAAVAETPHLSERLGPDDRAVRKHLVRDLLLVPLDGRGRMQISYRNSNAADAAAVMAVVVAEFSKLMDENNLKSAEEQAKIESLRFSVSVLEQTATELQARLASDYDLPADQAAYERLAVTLVAVTTDLQARRDYLATLETAYTRYEITRPASTPRPVREGGPMILAGLWGVIAFIATTAFVLLRAAIDNALKDPRSAATLERIAGAFRFRARSRS